MRSQKKNSKLKSLVELPKHKQLHINPQFDFGIRHSCHPQSVPRKNGIRTIECRTEESSPIHCRVQQIAPLPQLHITKSSHFLPTGKVVGSKTVSFLDNLIDILKEDEAISHKLNNRKRINTEQSAYRRSLPKRPKIVRNQMTRKFFEPVCFNRNIKSQDGLRKEKNKMDKNQKIQQFTFYGKKKFKLGGEAVYFERSPAPGFDLNNFE